ncbi:NADP-dependent oxidoreductase [Streptomyces apocyni]|uniref:NADP-dependent oxidoreductase n=1 Tax=Streptomyces apocyni TaxID=2654677 RepID=UPI0012E9F71F|nr:NADP-dependent oxidoreductase [Streptomyces apocyni]
MEAIVYEKFGGPGVLRLADVDEPHPGPGQVRLRVQAAGVNPIDYKIRYGWLEGVVPTTFPATPGIEAAGVVDEVGHGVTELKGGDEVLGWTDTGAYAECALATVVAVKPPELGWEEAAALPVATETAQRVLDLLAVGAGETLLLHGAAGAVGTAGVQLAVARGARVIGTASPANHDYLRVLGAVPVRYGDGLASRVREVSPEGVDAVFDAAGRGALPDSIALRGGTTDRIITIADPNAPDFGVTLLHGGSHHATALARHAALAARGTLRVPVAGRFPLADAAKAMEVSEGGHVRGKLVLLP